MKIPADNIAQSLLKPLDTEATSAALDSSQRLSDLLGTASPALPDASDRAAAVTRDPGETMLAADVWDNDDGIRRLDLSFIPQVQLGDSAALDKAVDTILAALG